MVVTIYKDIKASGFHHVPLHTALARIKDGRSLERVKDIRMCLDKERADELKKLLPCVCFSGKFGDKHTDASLLEHSGLLVLDFDYVEDVEKRKKQLFALPYVLATWVSPRGVGVKALVKIANGKFHTKHFDALKKEFPDVDPSGRNVSRLCFESYDPDILVKDDCEPWTEILKTEVKSNVKTTENDQEIFQKLLVWLSNKGGAFQSGERNNFVYRLASACCRFGIAEDAAVGLIGIYAMSDNSFSQKECRQTVKSAYRSNSGAYNTAEFSKETLIYKETRMEVEVESSAEILEIVHSKDIIYGEDVRDAAIDFYRKGYEHVKPVGIPALDELYKKMKTELTIISGYGNYGKSSFYKWYLLLRMVVHGEKFAWFGPEDSPPEMFYHDLTETMLGADCTPKNGERPDEAAYRQAYDWVSKRIFYVYPKSMSPTPDYIKEIFLSLIIKENVDGVVIDPFNQMTNDYGKSGGRSDKYLETFLSDCSRFAKDNHVYFDIITHPTKGHKAEDGNYPCPDIFDIAEGAMWNNKADNIIIYHRPFAQKEPNHPACQMHLKKIRRGKAVGIKGVLDMELHRPTRRFLIQGRDWLGEAIGKMNGQAQAKSPMAPNSNFMKPVSSQDIKELEDDRTQFHPSGKDIWE